MGTSRFYDDAGVNCRKNMCCFSGKWWRKLIELIFSTIFPKTDFFSKIAEFEKKKDSPPFFQKQQNFFLEIYCHLF